VLFEHRRRELGADCGPLSSESGGVSNTMTPFDGGLYEATNPTQEGHIMISFHPKRRGMIGGLSVAALYVVCAASGRTAYAGSFRGDMLVASQRNSEILAFDPTTGAYQGVFANLGSGEAQTLAEGPNGNIYVTSPASGNVQEYDGATGQIITTFHFSPTNSNNYASGITFDSSGNLYVVDTRGGTVNQYDPTTGAFIRTVISGLPSGPPAGGVGVTFASGGLYVTSLTGIQQFDLNGDAGPTFGGRTFYQITTGPNGNLYAADGSSSIYEFTPSGSQVGTGPFATGVSGAYGSGFDPSGNIYVGNNGNGVYKFDPSGSPVGSAPFFTNSQLVNATDVLYDLAPASVPEPGTLVLMMIGMATVAIRRRPWKKRG
jgi:streptogramin lyase